MSSHGGRQRPAREGRAIGGPPAHEKSHGAHGAAPSNASVSGDERPAAVTSSAPTIAVAPTTGPRTGSYAPSVDSALDLDVTVLAFAQWVSEMKSKQHHSQNQMQAEMSIIRNSITSNNTELADFKRHSAAIQQQMQSETNEIRESLSNVFMEITNAVRNNAAADQDIKLKIQSLNEQAVRNETQFAQLADAADQSQSKLRSAVKEMQHNSERMRDELVALNRHMENLETTITDRSENTNHEVEQLSQDMKVQLERRREQLKKMVNDVCGISNSLTSWMSDFSEQKKGASEIQNKIQSSLYVLDQSQRREGAIRDAVQSVPSISGQPVSCSGGQMRVGGPAPATQQQIPLGQIPMQMRSTGSPFAGAAGYR
jgi:septal ring factor EnvC (AmiA/AmiB activator)